MFHVIRVHRLDLFASRSTENLDDLDELIDTIQREGREGGISESSAPKRSQNLVSGPTQILQGKEVVPT